MLIKNNIWKCKNLLFISILALFLFSCSTTAPTNTSQSTAVQYRGIFVIENDNYKFTNETLERLAAKYDGKIILSSQKKDKHSRFVGSEITIKISYKNFNQYVESMKLEFRNDIISEKITKESFNEVVLKSKQTQQKALEESLESISKNLKTDDGSNISEIKTLTMKNNIEELDALLSDINSDIESMKYSTLEINWKSFDPQIQSETSSDEHEGIITGKKFTEEYSNIDPVPFNPVPNFTFLAPVQPMIVSPNSKSPEVLSPMTSQFDSQTGTIKLSPQQDNENIFQIPGIPRKIRIEDKCQIVEIPFGNIPEIELGEKVKKEQIIFTPIVDDKCNVIGLEIRAGTIQAGCKEGRHNLIRLNNCFNNKSIKNQSHRKPVWKKKHTQSTQKQPKTMKSDPTSDYFYTMPLD